MPKRTDIKKICIIGAGPIVIGQACEFDYSGVQACKALKEEGYEVVLVNSNPATIMTDPVMADHTYIEPLTPEMLAAILRKERPDAILPTLGGQTGLNLGFKVAEMGVLDELGIEMLGANAEVIHHAEDREDFRATVAAAGVDLPRSDLAHNMDEALKALEYVGLPCIIRPAFTLGGTGGGVAYNREEFMNVAKGGLDASMVHEILIEESLLGWKELEMELMRDSAGNCVVVCSIENQDPMGVHTGDSITVAPVQTLTDREYAKLVEDSKKIVEAIGLKAAGCNLQFAQHPDTGRMVAIELNPRVSRSSALASKATGFPIAKIAVKVAIGYTLDELKNDITKTTSACFEPTIDYVVIKIPRFAFEKFPGGNETLTISMKSVGEVMAIGRTYCEALQKGVRSMETKRYALVNKADLDKPVTRDELIRKMSTPTREQFFAICRAIYEGISIDEIFDITKMDRWWLENVKLIMDKDKHLQTLNFEELSAPEMLEAKKMGFSDNRLAEIFGVSEEDVRRRRLDQGIDAVCKLVDTCACEHEAITPYYYTTYEGEDETRTSETPKVLILGGGPNRIGQGIEFDYCCCHAAFAVKELG
ncbi:MAG: carbamoyl-phosphate synthase large subunit, partial [Thermoguttaceae bacterium]|nr:carbamoyl-phosphate synthase large subunit [Thermoguttaceae bacterium]